MIEDEVTNNNNDKEGPSVRLRSLIDRAPATYADISGMFVNFVH